VRAEQKTLMESYTAELCSIVKSRWGCDVAFTPPLLNIPVVPCNFIPVDAQLYSGMYNREPLPVCMSSNERL